MGERGVLRVGYIDDACLLSSTRRGELVGFDVEMALQLASDLGVRAELVPIDRAATWQGSGSTGACDIVMAGVAVTTVRAAEMSSLRGTSTRPSAFIVRDTLASLRRLVNTVRALGT